MPRKMKHIEPENYREKVEARYRDLSARADEALERVGDLPRPARRDAEPAIDQLEGARELMSSQVMALKRATDAQFRILQRDVERVSNEFESAVQRLDRMTQDDSRVRVRKSPMGRHADTTAPPHPEPEDIPR